MRYSISSSARRALVLLAAVLATSACATKRDVRDLRTEISEELRRVAASQDSLRAFIVQQSLETQDTLRSASRELGDIRGDVLTQLNRIANQLNQIEELAGQNSLNISALRDQLEQVRRGGTPAAGSGAGDPMEATSGTLSSGTGAADAMYNAAVRQYNRASLTAARAAFQQFLTSHPTHDLAPKAHFYLADILVQEEQLNDAIEAFSEIPELFPSADEVPDALYRIGILHAELGNLTEARGFLERVVNTYPDHRVAGLARAKLDEIRSPSP